MLFVINTENLKTKNHHLFSKGTLGLSIVFSKCVIRYKKHLKRKNQLKY